MACAGVRHNLHAVRKNTPCSTSSTALSHSRKAIATFSASAKSPTHRASRSAFSFALSLMPACCARSDIQSGTGGMSPMATEPPCEVTEVRIDGRKTRTQATDATSNPQALPPFMFALPFLALLRSQFFCNVTKLRK